MPRWKPKRCKVEGCLAEPDEISGRGYCRAHGLEREQENQRQLAEGEGPFYEHYVYQWSLAARRRLVALNQTKG